MLSSSNTRLLSPSYMAAIRTVPPCFTTVQTILCCVFISNRICTVCLITFLDQIAIFIIAVGCSRIAPDLCIGAFDELVGIVVLIVIFCFADTILDLLVRGPVSNLVISIIMDCLFTALCFFLYSVSVPSCHRIHRYVSSGSLFPDAHSLLCLSLSVYRPSCTSLPSLASFLFQLPVP